jgi:DNA primase
VLYHKSTVLYGLHQAREAIRQSRSVLLVEGYFDVVAAHKAGVKNAVAVSGTALTEDHVKLLKRYSDAVILCLDQDRAGQQAAGRAFQLLAKAQVDIRSITIPAKDPDELVQENPALFKEIADTKTVPFLDGLLEQFLKASDAAQPAGKRRFRDMMFALVSAFPDIAQRRAYLEKLVLPLGVTFREIELDFSTHQTGDVSRKGTKELVSTNAFTRFELCIGIALVYPRVRALLSELIPSDDKDWEAIRTALVASQEPGLDAVMAGRELDPVLKEKIGVLALYCEESFGQLADTLAAKTLKKQCADANRELMVRKQNEIVAELREARKAGRADEEVRLLTKYQQVIKLAKMAQ